jgi:hypothetical protein
MTQGNLDQAQVYLTDALTTAREIDKKAAISSRLVKLGINFYLKGKLQEGKQYFRECILLTKRLRRFRKINVLILITNYIPFPNTADSARILGAIDESQRKNERPINPLRKRYYDHIVERARATLGDMVFQAAFEAGQKMSLEAALDLALQRVEEM